MQLVGFSSFLDAFRTIWDAEQGASYESTKKVIRLGSYLTAIPAACIAMLLVIALGYEPALSLSPWLVTALVAYLAGPVPLLLVYGHASWQKVYRTFSKAADRLDQELVALADTMTSEQLTSHHRLSERG